MRKSIFFVSVLSLFLQLPASITRAQSVSITGVVYQNNAVKIPYKVPEGSITVSLPDDVMAGDLITGTVSLVPDGKNEKAKNNSLPKLEKYMILDENGNPLWPGLQDYNSRLPGDRYGFSWKVPDDKKKSDEKNKYTSIQLKDSKGNPVTITKINLINPEPGPTEELKLEFNTLKTEYKEQDKAEKKKEIQKKVITQNENIVIYTYPSTPDPDNTGWTETECYINGKKVHPVCSSPRQIIIPVPPGTIGKSSIAVKDNNGKTVFEDEIYVVDVKASIDKSNLRENETTTMHVSIDGVKDCPYPVQLVIVNKSSAVVSLEKGDHQTYPFYGEVSRLDLDDFVSTRTGHYPQIVTGKNPGAYNITANLVLPTAAFGDVFHQQTSVLNTPGDFNSWTNAIKKDLKAYAGNQVNSEAGKIVMANAQRAIDNIPVCNDIAKLAECKAITEAYLRSVSIPKEATTMWLSGFEADKTAMKAIHSTISGNPQLINWEMIRNGLAYADRLGKILGYDLHNASHDAGQLVNQIQTTGETNENLNKLNEALNVLDTRLNKALTEMPAAMNMLLPGGIFFSTKFTPPGLTTLAVEITDIAWDKSPGETKKDAIKVEWHFTGDITVKQLSVRVNWTSKDGKKSASADYMLSFKDGVDYHSCDTLPIWIDWPDGFKPAGIVAPLPKDELDNSKTKVIVFVNGGKVGEGKPEDKKK